MKKEVLFILLNDFADSEGAYIASCLNYGVMPGSESQYVVKTVAPAKEPVISMGGFRVLPDYSIDDIPADHAGVVLIGGMSWFTPEASLFVPVVGGNGEPEVGCRYLQRLRFPGDARNSKRRAPHQQWN